MAGHAHKNSKEAMVKCGHPTGSGGKCQKDRYVSVQCSVKSHRVPDDVWQARLDAEKLEAELLEEDKSAKWDAREGQHAEPTKYVPHLVDDFIDLLEDGNTLEDAAKVANVTHRTIYRWINEHPEFADAVEKAKALARTRAVGLIMLSIEGIPTSVTTKKFDPQGNIIEEKCVETTEVHPDMALKFLERRDPDNWKLRTAVDVGSMTAEQMFKELAQSPELLAIIAGQVEDE